MIDKIKSLFNKPENNLTKFVELNPSFELVNKGNISFITIGKKVETEDIQLLLEKLWIEKCEITFHDTIHPTLSDPGAYFSYSTEKSEKKNVWSMTYGNHGWSGGIYHLNEKTVAKQITNLIHETSMNEIQITDVCFFSHYELKDKESSTKKDYEIFEMHNKN
jgi:hypothetical protein